MERVSVILAYWKRYSIRRDLLHTSAQVNPWGFGDKSWQLLELVRRHWTIENRLHWRRDVTLGEDHCQVRTGEAPLVLAALNNVVLALFDFLGVRNVPQQMRRLDAHPAQALRLVLGSLLTIK